jgi:hypothetical protein
MTDIKIQFGSILRLRKPEEPDRLRFIERKGRYILQELCPPLSASAMAVLRWRDVPLVKEIE